MIKEGDIFPNNKVTVVGSGEPKENETDELFSGKKVIFLFGNISPSLIIFYTLKGTQKILNSQDFWQ